MDYGRTSKYYTLLSRIFFGRAIDCAHVLALQHFPPGAAVMLMGGGTGTYLPYVKNYRITFVDNAKEMVDLAKKHAQPNFHFQLADARSIEVPEHCDGVVFAFLLDSWTDNEVRGRLASLPLHCPVVVADFSENPRGLLKIMLKSMYLFFSWFAGVKVKRMPAIEKLMREASRQKVTETSLYYSFIEVKVYVKSTSDYRSSLYL